MSRTRTFAPFVFAAAAVTMAAAATFVWAPREAVAPAATAPIAFSNPYDDVQPFMEGLYAADRAIAPTPEYRIRAVIVPHHLVSSGAIAAGFRILEGQSFSRIVLLSPDHFHRCPTVLCAVDGAFSTAFGEVRGSDEAMASLRASALVTEDAALFRGEHGVHAVLPFIAEKFPGTPVVPLALSQRVPWKPVRAALLDVVRDAVGDDGILVVSSDFSHYLPLAAAEDADERTATALFAKDLDGIAKLENPAQSDCPGCLWLIASLADRDGFYNPSVLTHTNSATILRDERVPETTSHFSVAWYANDSLSGDDPAVAGDVTVTRGVPALADGAAAWWQGHGPRLVNLEGPVAARCAERENPYLFCNDLAAWSTVAGLATHWAVENNHMLDLGAAARKETVRLLEAAGETAVDASARGDGRFRAFALTTVINPVAGAKESGLPQAHAAVTRALRAAARGDFSVVLVHGGAEFRALAPKEDALLWEGLIDAGADAVFVAHSHVPGDIRIYKGKPIFRGLGNFLFDQRDDIATSTAKLVRLRKAEDGHVMFQTGLFTLP